MINISSSTLQIAYNEPKYLKTYKKFFKMLKKTNFEKLKTNPLSSSVVLIYAVNTNKISQNINIKSYIKKANFNKNLVNTHLNKYYYDLPYFLLRGCVLNVYYINNINDSLNSKTGKADYIVKLVQTLVLNSDLKLTQINVLNLLGVMLINANNHYFITYSELKQSLNLVYSSYNLKQSLLILMKSRLALRYKAVNTKFYNLNKNYLQSKNFAIKATNQKPKT